jgi:hypothetical protein
MAAHLWHLREMRIAIDGEGILQIVQKAGCSKKSKQEGMRVCSGSSASSSFIYMWISELLLGILWCLHISPALAMSDMERVRISSLLWHPSYCFKHTRTMEGYLSTLPSHTMRPCETGNDTPGVISLVFSNQFVLEASSTFRQTDSRDNTPGVLSQAFSDLFVLANDHEEDKHCVWTPCVLHGHARCQKVQTQMAMAIGQENHGHAHIEERLT